MADATLSERAETPEPGDDADESAITDEAADIYRAKTERLKELGEIANKFVPSFVTTDDSHAINWGDYPGEVRKELIVMATKVMKAVGDLASESTVKREDSR